MGPVRRVGAHLSDGIEHLCIADCWLRREPQCETELVQGVTDKNGNFTATQIGNDANGNLVDKTTGNGAYTASVNGSGVQFSTDGGKTSSTGVFVNRDANATSFATSFQDAGWANGGNLSSFNFTFTNSKLEAGRTAAGTFDFSGDLDQARSAIQAAGFRYWPVGVDFGSDEFRSPGDPGTGANSGHFIVNRGFLPPKSGYHRLTETCTSASTIRCTRRWFILENMANEAFTMLRAAPPAEFVLATALEKDITRQLKDILANDLLPGGSVPGFNKVYFSIRSSRC